MFDRIEVKKRGKAVFRASYWNCVGAAFVMTLVAGAYNGVNIIRYVNMDYSDPYSEPYNEGIGTGTIFLVSIVVGVLSIFVFNVLSLGCSRFFLINSYSRKAKVEEIGSGFGPYYKSIVSTMFLTSVYIAIWTLLLIIPGIVKSYAYRLVPYIISEDPAMNSSDAMHLSEKLMYGKKWDAFVYDLSFIGWYILSVLTLGLLTVFYVNPYKYQSDAELYRAIRYPEELKQCTEYADGDVFESGKNVSQGNVPKDDAYPSDMQSVDTDAAGTNMDRMYSTDVPTADASASDMQTSGANLTGTHIDDTVSANSPDKSGIESAPGQDNKQ